MSRFSRRYVRSMLHFEAVVRRVPISAWGNQTCCSEWTAREVVGHTLKVMTFTEAACGIEGTVPEGTLAEIAGDDPALATGMVVNRVWEALQAPGVLEHHGPTIIGEMTVDDFVGAMWIDPMTHSWDLADSAGIDHGISDDEANDLYAEALEAIEAFRGPGGYADALEGSNDPVGRLMAFLGRTSIRS